MFPPLFPHKQLPIYASSSCQAALAFIWNLVCGHLMNMSPVFCLLLALFLVSTNPKGHIWDITLHHVSQLVANIIWPSAAAANEVDESGRSEPKQ